MRALQHRPCRTACQCQCPSPVRSGDHWSRCYHHQCWLQTQGQLMHPQRDSPPLPLLLRLRPDSGWPCPCCPRSDSGPPSNRTRWPGRRRLYRCQCQCQWRCQCRCCWQWTVRGLVQGLGCRSAMSPLNEPRMAGMLPAPAPVRVPAAMTGDKSCSPSPRRSRHPCRRQCRWWDHWHSLMYFLSPARTRSRCLRNHRQRSCSSVHRNSQILCQCQCQCRPEGTRNCQMQDQRRGPLRDDASRPLPCCL